MSKIVKIEVNHIEQWLALCGAMIMSKHLFDLNIPQALTPFLSSFRKSYDTDEDVKAVVDSISSQIKSGKIEESNKWFNSKKKTIEEIMEILGSSRFDLMNKCGSIEVSTEQASVIQKSLDGYSRSLAGQVLYGLEILTDCIVFSLSAKPGLLSELRDECYNLTSVVAGLSRGESLGICNKDLNDVSRVSYDMLRVIRNKLAYDKHPDGAESSGFKYSNSFDHPGTPYSSSVKEHINVTITEKAE